MGLFVHEEGARGEWRVLLDYVVPAYQDLRNARWLFHEGAEELWARGARKLVAEGRFRDDLLYRVNPVTLRIPPLRARGGDIPRLFQHFAAAAAGRHGREGPEVPPETLLAVASRDWPGNLRELKNAAERFILGIESDPAPGAARGLTLAERIDRFERDVLTATLAAHDGSLKATYESLGLARKTLYEKMQKHGLRREDFSD